MNDESAPETWAYATDEEDIFRMGFESKAAALAGLGDQSGEVVRYERGIAKEGLGDLFDIDVIVSKLEEHLQVSDVIGDHENGLVDASDAEKSVLRERLADAVKMWAIEVDLRVWQIVRRVEVDPSLV